MLNRSLTPYAVAGIVVTASALYYVFSSLSLKKSRYIVAPVTITSSASARDVYLFLRDPNNYLDLTPESKYTVITFEETAERVDYTLHHQITTSRAALTKCRRDWDDARVEFWDPFPVLRVLFRVCMRVLDEGSEKVKVEAEMEIEASAQDSGASSA